MVKFKTCYDKMSDPAPINPITDHVSVLEDCHVLTIPDMLKMMVGTSMDKILGFGAFDGQYDDAFDPEHPELGGIKSDAEDKILSTHFAYEDDQADASDVFMENQALQQQFDIELQNKNNNLSAGECPTTHSQADTTLTAESGTKTKSPSKSDVSDVE